MITTSLLPPQVAQNYFQTSVQTFAVGNQRIIVIQPNGSKFDRFEADKVLKTIDNYGAAHAFIEPDPIARFLLDLRHAELLDSGGLNTLVVALKNAIALGTTLSLCCLQDTVKLVFEITRMDEVFTIFDRSETFITLLQTRPTQMELVAA